MPPAPFGAPDHTDFDTMVLWATCGEQHPDYQEGLTANAPVFLPPSELPTNTGGGQLSSFYMWGMTPMSEAVIQARGQGGIRQVPKNDLVLCTGNGGVLNYHASLVLSPHRN